MFRPIPFLHSYDVTASYTPHETQSPYFTRVQDGGLHTTPRCSLLPTLRNTIYQASRRHHTFLFFFPKISFSKIFWALSRGPRGFSPIFEFPYSPYISPNFFPTFEHNSDFLLHGTAKRLNSTLLRPSCTTPRGARPLVPRHTWPSFTPRSGGA